MKNIVKNSHSNLFSFQSIKAPKPLLVAVSKTKPAEKVIDCYSVGQRHFGENYVQELIEKGSDPTILESCSEIKWHFIGKLQTNKINKVIKTPGIYMIETVDSEKLASNLDSAWEKLSKTEKLRVLVQINTSSEGAKNGVEPADCTKLYQHILENCKNLKLDGIMTIGKFGHDYSTGPNPDFICLMKCHEDVCNTFGLGPDDVHVSMGMSDDFEKAVSLMN